MTFNLEEDIWYGAEFIGDEFAEQGRHYSPIQVMRLKPLKTGRGDLRSLEHLPTRLLLITRLTWKWLGEQFQIYPRDGQDDVQRRFG